jgi:putative membrane protein
MNSIDARHTVAALLAGTVLLAGCGRSDHSAATADTAMGQPTAAGASTGVAMTPPAGSTATAGADTTHLSDANIVAKVEAGDSSEVAVASYMQSHASSAGVKSYATMLVDDHGKDLRETKALASRLNITPQMPPSDTTAQKTAHALDHLKSLSGTNADTAFVNAEVLDHVHDIPEHKDLAAQAQNPQLKSAIEKSIPVLQKHLDRAEQLQKQQK